MKVRTTSHHQQLASLDPFGIVSWCKSIIATLQDPNVPVSAKWIALGAVLYPISPVNLIAENIWVLGQLDDLFILIFAGIGILNLRENAAQSAAIHNSVSVKKPRKKPTVRKKKNVTSLVASESTNETPQG